MDDRLLDLTEEQKATKAKYPPINKKYECKTCALLTSLNSFFAFVNTSAINKLNMLRVFHLNECVLKWYRSKVIVYIFFKYPLEYVEKPNSRCD